jgi:hypothetical protein
LCPPEAKFIDGAIERVYDKFKDYLLLEKFIVSRNGAVIAHVKPGRLYFVDCWDRFAYRIYYSFVLRIKKDIPVEMTLQFNVETRTIESYFQQSFSRCVRAESLKRMSELRSSYASIYDMSFTVGFPDEILGRPLLFVDDISTTCWIESMIHTFVTHECVRSVARYNYKLVFASRSLPLTEDVLRHIYDKLDGRVSYDADLLSIGIHSFGI